LEDLRWPIAVATTHAIEADFPLGVGFGAFEPIYQMFESSTATLPPYVNHAHDDWLELALDGGLPMMVLLGAFIAWFIRASIRTWRDPPAVGNAVDCALARAAPIFISLLLLHSTVDYPLRTTALMVILAFGTALLIPSFANSGTGEDPPRHLLRKRRRSRVAEEALI
jgi:O-antigen ligase